MHKLTVLTIINKQSVIVDSRCVQTVLYTVNYKCQIQSYSTMGFHLINQVKPGERAAANAVSSVRKQGIENKKKNILTLKRWR